MKRFSTLFQCAMLLMLIAAVVFYFMHLQLIGQIFLVVVVAVHTVYTVRIFRRNRQHRL